MGWVEIIKADGTNITLDGGEATIYRSDVCDGCGVRQLRKFGRTLRVGVDEVLWLCDTCNTPRT